MGLRDQILAADDLPRHELHIPEWGVTVYVRTLTGRERDRLDGVITRSPYVDARAHLAVMCLVDDTGQQIFKPEDVPALSAKSAPALDRISAIAMKVNTMTKEDFEDLKKG